MKLRPRTLSREARAKHRARVNAIYHQNAALKNPAHKKQREKAWRDANREKVNSAAREYYERNAARISEFNSWKNRLSRMLERIVRSQQARGMVE
jgi:hypothetical protein